MNGLFAVNLSSVAITTVVIVAFVVVACLAMALTDEGGWHAVAGAVLGVILLFALLFAVSYRAEQLNKRTLVCEDRRSGEVVVRVCR